MTTAPTNEMLVDECDRLSSGITGCNPYPVLKQAASALRLAANPSARDVREALELFVTDSQLMRDLRRYFHTRNQGMENWLEDASRKADAALSNLDAAAPAAGGDLDERQRVVIEWGKKCFGADHMADPIIRAARFMEEAVELVQAVGLPKDHALRAFDHVYSRPAGEPKQEIGGAANTLMALCGALGHSLDECQRAEIERCLEKDPSHFAARNQVKLNEVDAAPPLQAPAHSDAVREALQAAMPFLSEYDFPGADPRRKVVYKQAEAALTAPAAKAPAETLFDNREMIVSQWLLHLSAAQGGGTKSESQAKATEGKAGMAGVTDTVRRSTAGTGLLVGETDAVRSATSEMMDVTAGETAPFPSDPPSQEASAPPIAGGR